MLYFALVQSILEYGVIVWHPYLAKDQPRFERVLKKCLSHGAFILNIDPPRHDYFSYVVCLTYQHFYLVATMLISI